MDDLLERCQKYGRSAGRTGEGQRQAAVAAAKASHTLGWSSVALSAVVGTALVSDMAAQYPVYIGLLSIGAAVLGALQQKSKLSERAEQYRKAAAQYGAIRRKADMLCLKIRGGDISRAEGLRKLDEIGSQLSKLAERAMALDDRIYDRSKAKFDREHVEYIQPIVS